MEDGDQGWVPYGFQLANWTMERPAVWAHGFPVEYVSTELSSASSCLQTPVVVPRSSTGEKQLVECTPTTTRSDDPMIKESAKEFEVDFHSMETKKIPADRIHVNPIDVFEERASEFKVDISMTTRKMHRYPPGIFLASNVYYTAPTMVSIGPYHHGRDDLTAAEKVKHVAAYQCIVESGGHSVQEMYDAVVAVAGDARRLYDQDAVAGLADDDFLPMMFYDACFLVQFMLSYAGRDVMDASLCSFFDANDKDITHDVLLLENQLPWSVVQAVMRFRPVPLENFIDSLKDCLQLQDRVRVTTGDEEEEGNTTTVLDDAYEPPHLLGLFRYYLVGASSTEPRSLPPTKSISFSVSAMELAEMGITLTANKKATELIQMGLKKEGTLFPELSLPPLSLNRSRASWLINMAALELCTTADFYTAEDEDSAVCSYLLLLAMLVDREEDVHELRTKHVLQGGGGLTNKEALDFFTSLQDLRVGSRYLRSMQEIENYRVTRRVQTRLHAFVYKNMKTIVAVFSAVGALVGIFGTLKGLKDKTP
ncbi:hypothetical protein BS78_05G263900 [Paspalum vaginatum]|nr:hypothetical protein BS78_05G263900 [Paspalum vaginatum]KAJ1277045.1 hypothetical protein BS78_05G263900 [Paspalum vaginatum]